MGREYDQWTADGVLEHFWGEHIHHGYYPEGRIDRDFRVAKVDMVDRLIAFAGVDRAAEVLDVGCGIGGSARHLAGKLGGKVVGVTLSPSQSERASALTPVGSAVRFEVADALHLPFPDARFDFVWACESGEHMPDKRRFITEMVRVLRPGGRLLVATWCHRTEPPVLEASERALLSRIQREWALPPFVSIDVYRNLAADLGLLTDVRVDDWSRVASPTWRHQIRLGIRGLPWLLGRGARVVVRSLRDAGAVFRMIRAYDLGTVRYNVFTATKVDAGPEPGRPTR